MAADVNELISKIDKLIDRLDSRASTNQTTREGGDYFTAQERNDRIYEDIRKDFEAAGMDLAEVEKEYNEQRKKIAQKYADDILSDLDKHSKNKIAILNEEKEKELEILREAGKDTTELEKKYAKEREKIFQSTLAAENKTVFQQLNERFAEEKGIYEKGSEEAKAITKKYWLKTFGLVFNQVGTLYGAIKNLVNAGEAQVKHTADTWGKTNQAAHDYGRTVGYNADQIEKLHKVTLSWMHDSDISENFNVSVEEMFKLMKSYNQSLSRAVALTNESKLNLVSMRNVIGEEQAIKFTTNLDKFGLDVDATKDLVEGLVGDAKRSGIVLSNLTQNVADNLHLAQQYTFEDGIEGLVRMAEKATVVKWNMEQTAAFAEKVNNVEGAIKTGAQLSVLGGPFAQFSNPMGMLYESLNDMEGLQDRMFAMFGSLGEWDQEKGMLDISAFDKQRIRAAASAMGLNYGDVINNINQQARRNVVMDQIKGYGLDENTTELIANTAQIDRETGRAYVNHEGEKIFVDEIGKRGDKDKIIGDLRTQAKTPDEKLGAIAKNTLGAIEMLDAIDKQIETDNAKMYDDMGVSKKTLADTYGVVQETNRWLSNIDRVVAIIAGLIAVGQTMAGFKGAFGGAGGSAPGMGGAVGAAGKTGLMQTLKSTPGVWGKTKAVGKWVGGNIAKYSGAAIGISAIGAAGSSLMDAQSQRLRANGNHDDADNVNIGSGALNGLAQGAAMGSVLGPWGMAAGALIGLTHGIFSANSENEKLERQRKEEEYRQKAIENRAKYIENEIKTAKKPIEKETGLVIKGEYSAEFLENLRKGKDSLGSNYPEQLYAQGDGEVWEKLPNWSFAQGGILKGPSHADGGMNVIDNQTGHLVAEVEGDEGIVPKTIMEKFGTVDNLINSAMRPLQPMGEIMMVNSNNNTPINSSLNVGGSANVNVGGTIQLSMPNGQTYNIAEDPAAMRMIGDSVMRHIMTANQQIFNKSEFYRKM